METIFQSHFGDIRKIILGASKILSKSELNSNLNFIGEVRAKQTPSKDETLHKVASSLAYTDTKINTTSQKNE